MFDPSELAIDAPYRKPVPFSASWWDEDPPSLSLPTDEAPPDPTDYRFDPLAYCRDILGMDPWASGDPEHPGQLEILELYLTALRQLHEQQAYNNGALRRDQLRYWQPGQTVKNWIRMESGHGYGKTFLMAAIASHMFDTCAPLKGYTFAPTDEQNAALIWAALRLIRPKSQPGVFLPAACRLEVHKGHWLAGKSVPVTKDTGAIQGLHGPYKLFLVDEAVDVGDLVFKSLHALTSSGICIVLLAANPANRTCAFHKLRTSPQVVSVRGSCLYHPNVVTGREVVPGGVKRDWVEARVQAWTEVVGGHDPARYTFVRPWMPEEIRAPRLDLDGDEFLYRVLGIAPGRSGAQTIVSTAQYDAARVRVPEQGDTSWATIGVDCSRFGVDRAAAASRWANLVKIFARLDHDNRDGAPTYEMLEAIRTEAKRLKRLGARNLYVRVDAGYGGGLIDALRTDVDLRGMFGRFVVTEVHFGGRAQTDPRIADRATELYVLGARELDQVRLVDPPDRLEQDLAERKYEVVQVKHGAGYRTQRKLSDKAKHKKDTGHSPDDGDAWALCIVPPELFGDEGGGEADRFHAAGKWDWGRG